MLGNVIFLCTFAPAFSNKFYRILTRQILKEGSGGSRENFEKKLQKKICQIGKAVVSLPTRKGASSFTNWSLSFEK